MKTLKTTSPQGKGLIERFKSLKVGQPCLFPSLLPSLSNASIQAFLLEVRPGKYWEFKLFWHGVEVGTVTAEVKADQLELEVS